MFLLLVGLVWVQSFCFDARASGGLHDFTRTVFRHSTRDRDSDYEGFSLSSLCRVAAYSRPDCNLTSCFNRYAAVVRPRNLLCIVLIHAYCYYFMNQPTTQPNLDGQLVLVLVPSTLRDPEDHRPKESAVSYGLRSTIISDRLVPSCIQVRRGRRKGGKKAKERGHTQS
jgi:hypothetical protein